MFRSRTQVSMKSVILFLALVAISLSQDDEDKRNPALEAVGTAAVGAGVLGGLLFGGAVVAKVLGDAAKAGDSSRSNGGNTGRQHHAAHISSSSGGTCSYNCDGWPYEQCKTQSRFASATCINPFTSKSSSQIFSNYPECANIPSGCERCDDVCSSRDGKKDKLDYFNSPKGSPPPQQSPPASQHRPSSDNRQTGDKTTRNCDYKCNGEGCTVRYIGPNRPGKISGSCFPDSFGGECSGTPPECQDCNKAISC